MPAKPQEKTAPVSDSAATAPVSESISPATNKSDSTENGSNEQTMDVEEDELIKASKELIKEGPPTRKTRLVPISPIQAPHPSPGRSRRGRPGRGRGRGR